ncbi:endopeptidase La [Nitratireductor aquimarinus]|uniref:endopeptidase La n=1 Tax=Alphaproteobacteria TaxID=28211 RepID=UPI0019D3C116|nr:MULTISPECIES: endopeptidase La [Alphaproteobacteria]MBY6023994.1 endopeptidase La [Nitratireductor sp. DP7N14-4]MBN7759033.1 endopeptidase La [Nitratireductor aquimarinus]MBN7778745.1 endopeptidase La [Nitratireductor pacificus]MBN7783068.1 endopeptidase La [Nitratireductor pacificus]MBN7791874.1 endopeptidase La [Nitratireductor aquimarinus]
MTDTPKTAGGALYPVLPLRDIVVFPHMIVPLFVGRDKSIKALEEVMGAERQILLATQMNAADDDPEPSGIYDIGTLANVLQLLKLPDGTVKVLVEGTSRARVSQFSDREEFHEATADLLPEPEEDQVEIEALARSVVSDFENYVKLNKKISPEVVGAANQIEDYSKLADTVASHLAIKIPEKQEMLATLSVRERLEKAMGFMEAEISVLQVEKRIRSRVKRQMEKTQREYYLNEQMKAIQKELGEGEDGRNEAAELEERIKKTKLSKEAREKAEAELKKLKTMSPMSAEATVVRNYLDWLLSIPWKKPSKIKNDLEFSENVLDTDHFGLEKVKERIVEYLAVQSRQKKLKGPILCLVGPPGVGKTSLAKSIAKATGREYVRMALGGVRDEAEIRGHRRTYIGSMPGKVIQSMKKAQKSNPLFLLDEIDKMGMDFRGDPSSALLEVLDPEQNSTFMDHYLEVEYDLSSVMFVTTANTLNIPPALMDRMEIIRIAGYTEDEKVEIAKRHLLPKAVREHALEPQEFSVTDGALREIIRTYTREAGVRNLERELMKLARKAVTEILRNAKKDGGKEKVEVTEDNLADYLGVQRYRFGQAEGEDQVGVVTGLAWTEVGGELLTIEGVMMPGKGKMTVTGNLRDVMKESISAAASYVRSRAVDFGIEPPVFDKKDIHVHVPEGATPKDGPSAGVAMATSIVSIMTGIPVRKDIAMTGEITLRGRVLPIGGLKEKLLAALRGGIKKVLIPEENAKDLADIPENVKNGLEIVPVSRVGEVLEHALVRMPEPIEWVEPAEPASKVGVGNEGPAVAH